MEERVAKLGIEVDSTQPASAAVNLDKLADSSVRAESAVEQLAAEARAAMAGLGGMSASAGGLNAALGSVGQMLDIVDATLADVASASRAAAGGADVATSAFRNEAQAAERTGGALREMAEQIRIAEQRELAAARASQEFAREVQGAGAAATVAKGNIDRAAKSFNDFYDEANRDFASQYVRQMNNTGVVNTKVANTMRLTASEGLNLSRQLADIGVSAAQGMNPLMIATQQLPQIADIFQTAAMRGVGFKAALMGMVELVAPFAALAASIGFAVGVLTLFGAAAIASEKEAAKLANTLTITGGQAGITASQFEAMTASAAKSANATVGEAREVSMALLSTGKIGGDAIQGMTETILRLSQYTGRSREDIGREFAGMGDDVTGFAQKFNEQYHVLTLAQYNHIAMLDEEGKATQAAEYLMGVAHEQIAKRGVAQLDILSQAWRGLRGVIDDAWEALKRFARASTVDDKIAAIEKQLKTGDYGYSSADPYATANQKSTKAELEGRLLYYKDLARWETEAAEAEGKRQKVTTDGISAQTEYNARWRDMGDNLSMVNREWGTYLDNQRKITAAADQEGITDPAARRKMGIDDQARQAEVHSEIAKKYTANATAAAKAADRAGDAAARRAENLAREAEAMEATIKGNFDLAAAYQLADDKAFAQVARVKATAEAIKKRGDIEEFVARQIRLNVSEQAASSAKTLAGLRTDTDARSDLNDKVADGTMTMAEANQALKDEAVLRPLAIALKNAEADKVEELTKLYKDLEEALKGSNAQTQRSTTLSNIEAKEREIALLKEEVRLTGQLGAVRDIALAKFQAEQNIAARGVNLAAITDPDERAVYDKEIRLAQEVAAWKAAAAMSQELYNKELDATIDKLSLLDDIVSRSSNGLAEAFNGMGEGIERVVGAVGAMTRAYSQYGVRRAQIDKEIKVANDRVANAKAIEAVIGNYGLEAKAVAEAARVKDRAAQESADLQIDLYAQMAGAAKGFFEEGSEGYEVLRAAEIAFRTVQFAMAIQAMALQAQESENAIVASMGKAVASTIAGVAKAFEQMGVWGFVGAGAIIAFMAAVGVNAGGAGGGAAYDLEGVQKRQATGSVLGDVDAKSESIVRALEMVADHTNEQLEYSNGMLRALRGIEDNIENLAAAVARSLHMGTMSEFETTVVDPLASRQFGKSAPIAAPFSSGNILRDIFLPAGADPAGLFDSKITRKLVDAGVNIAAQSVADIVDKGLKGSYFQILRTTREDKAFGFTYNTSTKDKTTYSAMEADLQRQFGLVIGSLRTGVIEAASVLGIDGAQAVIDAFQVNIGKISFKDMDSDEIQKTLEAVFSKVGDEMAGAILPGLTEFQKAGEGLFETLIRVARQYQVIDVTLSSIGMTFGAVGVASLAARERLVDLFGGLDDFTSQVSFYGENFLSEAERLAPVQAALNAELARLGITGLDTREEFKDLVQGLDLSTAAGAELFHALMQIAPAFAAVTEETQRVADARDDLSDAYEREAGAIEATRDRMAELAASLGKFKASLYSGPAAALTPEQQYAANKAEFERVAALAAQGNEQALGDLESVSQAYLDASRDYFASSEGYFQDLAAVRAAVTAAEAIAGSQVSVAQAQLDQLKAAVAGILNLNTTTLTFAQALTAYNAAIANALGATGQTPVVVTPTGVVVPATSTTGTTTTTPTTTPTSPTTPTTGGPANDNSDVVAELQAMNAALSARLARLEAQQEAAMRQQSAISDRAIEQGDKLLEVQDKTVTALRATR